MAARGLSNGQYQGSKWITRERRLAIYVRDGLACVYCAEGIEDGTVLTLDHVIPFGQGGSTKSVNLLTACRRCNSSRADRAIAEFAETVADYLNHGVTAAEIVNHCEATRSRPVDITAAKALIAQRGSYAAALAAARQ